MASYDTILNVIFILNTNCECLDLINKTLSITDDTIENSVLFNHTRWFLNIK